ncbi:hypothetical protein CEXT_669801 [Caerostris extrusa]|uniref:Uncharacterized protein n=1 Tax=Caerostris extrusa TaxID=172846 RepID=A0AAV4PDH4_CAEEX|nr:hypothetical protein CEXT_669801 [Caerostris extrusa]
MERGSSREIAKSSFRSLNPLLIQKVVKQKITSKNKIDHFPFLRDPVDLWRRALKAKWRGVAPEKSPKAHLDRLILFDSEGMLTQGQKEEAFSGSECQHSASGFKCKSIRIHPGSELASIERLSLIFIVCKEVPVFMDRNETLESGLSELKGYFFYLKLL